MESARSTRATCVSVIVPTRDRSAYLRQALASVRALEGPDLRFEIIVADNGSRDDTPAVARQFGARFLQCKTRGAAAARNTGLRALTGEFVAFLDDDDVWLPDHVRPHLKLMAERADLAGVIGQVQNANQQLSGLGDPWPSDMPTDGDVFASLLRVTPQIGATIVRPWVLDSVGFQDETLESDEDWDWHLRIAQRHRVGFVAVPCVLFRQRPTASAGADELFWKRWPYTYRVLRSNLRRAGRRRIGFRAVVRIMLNHGGLWAGSFLDSAVARAAGGDRPGARRTLVWAMRVSPLHVAHRLARDVDLRRAALFAFVPGYPPTTA